MVRKLLPFVLLVCGMFPLPSLAQWKSDSTTNTAVCIATGSQQNPQACGDGANGVIVVWEDYRSATDWDIYAQKLNADGIPQWTADGINVCISTADQTAPVICSDGSGGAYIAWKDSRTSANGTDLYAQHITANGTLGYGASGAGIAVAVDAAAPDNLAICPDGNGNAFVAWADSRTSITPANTRPNIWMNKLTPAGAVWGGTAGISVISQALHQTNPQLVDDDSGGCFLTWINHSDPAGIYCTRVNTNGTSLWGAIGVEIYTSTQSGNDSRNQNISRDGKGLCVSWEVNNSLSSTKGWNVLATRLQSDGTLVWATTFAAPEISTDWPGDQINSSVFSDDSSTANGAAGLLVVYEDYSGTHGIVMTRLQADGTNIAPASPNQLFTVCRQSYNQTLPKAVKTGSSELLIVWNDTRLSSGPTIRSSIYAQRCDKTPKRFLGPSPSLSSWGVAVSNRAKSNADEVVLVPRSDGGIAVWRDNRNGNTDIYAQLIFRDGTLPIELSNFTVSLVHKEVLLNWETASEKDNAGFEVERRFVNDAHPTNTFEVVGSYLNNSSLLGAGFSNTKRDYSFIDHPDLAGLYEYRLADYSLDGERTVHESKTVNVADVLMNSEFSIGQNIPNPFADETNIPIVLSKTAIVNVAIMDILGRVIATPYDDILLEMGPHSLAINSSSFNSSGAYYYMITIRDPETGVILWKMPKAGMMLKITN